MCKAKDKSPFARRRPSHVTEKASFIFGRSTGYGEGFAAGLKEGARRERRVWLSQPSAREFCDKVEKMANEMPSFGKRKYSLDEVHEAFDTLKRELLGD